MSNRKILQRIRMLEKAFTVEPQTQEWENNCQEIRAILKEYPKLSRGRSQDELNQIAREAAREIAESGYTETY